MPGLRPVRRLESGDDLSTFESGEPVLDEWLKRFAWPDQRASVSVTYVLPRGDRVVGFYTLAPSSIDPPECATRLAAGLPSERAVPVILLARLAIDKSEHGKGVGSDLFRDALLRSIASADSIGGRAVLVHAKHDEAATFYRRHGFEPLPDNAMHLYRLMKDLRASLPQPKSS